MTFKAIETIYNGYKFRSRLEARYAVLFEHLDLSFEYEPEGFDLGDGVWYLPDFCIDGSLWIEIKPPLTNGEGIEKAEKFVMATGMPLAICWGSPWYPDWDKGRGVLLYERCDNGEAPPCVVRSFANWLGLEGMTPERLHKAYVAARQARFERRQKRQWRPRLVTQQV